MAFKRFYVRCLLASAVLLALWLTFVICRDDFGLFRDVSRRELRIYGSERYSKYLFSRHYIPAKFNGVLLGPSLSDIIDTRTITAAKIYNLSLTGGDATELRRLFENVASRSRDLKVLVICVDPYLTRKNTIKEFELDSRLYWSSFGSIPLIRYYLKKDRVLRGKSQPDMSINTEWGRYHYIIPRTVTASDLIRSYAGKSGSKFGGYQVDESSLADLKGIVDLARQKRMKIFAYYHPYPDLVYAVIREQYAAYQARMAGIFGQDQVWDFNAPRYAAFRGNYANYLDHAHLSDQGAAYIAKEIDRLLATGPAGN